MITIHVNGDLCKGCGLCLYFCHRDVFRLSQAPNRKGYNVVEVCAPEACTACRLCEIGCPDFALFLEKEEASSSGEIAE